MSTFLGSLKVSLPSKTWNLTAAFLAAILLLWPGAAVADDVVYELDNGLEVILKESHGSPMIACIVFVKSGSRYESRFENDRKIETYSFIHKKVYEFQWEEPGIFKEIIITRLKFATIGVDYG